MAIDQNILEISLAGFQTFDKLTHIPLRRLTLLFGPNSAGKSAIEDALEILYELYGNEKNSHAWADRYDVSKEAMPAALSFAGLGKGVLLHVLNACISTGDARVKTWVATQKKCIWA